MFRLRIAAFSAALGAALLVAYSHPLGQSPALPDDDSIDRDRRRRRHASGGSRSSRRAAQRRPTRRRRQSGRHDDRRDGFTNALGSIYRGVPLFGGQVVRQMDGRSVISLAGRIHEGMDLSVVPSLAPERAGELALATAPPEAQVQGDVTLGILPLADGSYRLDVSS